MAFYGYARVSSLDQDLTVQRQALPSGGVQRDPRREGKRQPTHQMPVESGGHAPAANYCASVSPNVRFVSPIVLEMVLSVSSDVRRNWWSIASRAIYKLRAAPLSTFRTPRLLFRKGGPFSAAHGRLSRHLLSA
jgi:hypothetical protein